MDNYVLLGYFVPAEGSVNWFLNSLIKDVSQQLMDNFKTSHKQERLFWKGTVRQISPSIIIHMKAIFYEVTKKRHSERAASRLSLNVLRVESDLYELNRLWNEAWIETNFCRLCMRLNRSMALSRRRKGKCEFSTLLFAHRVVTCFSEQPSSLAAAP